MQRVRSSRSRSETARGVHLQHIDATDATRAAHIAAGKAFVHNQERNGPEAPQTLFPDPFVGAHPQTTRHGKSESNTCPPTSASQLGSRPQSGSIRFVQNGGQTISSARLEATRANMKWAPGAFQTPVRNTAPSDVHPASRCTAGSESNYSQYTSSLPCTPMNKLNINKTWSASQVRNKENFGGAAANTAMARNTIHISTAPRRTIMSQRHWTRPSSRGSIRSKASSTSTALGSRSLRAATNGANPTAHCFGQPVFFRDTATKTGSISEYNNQASDVYSATQRHPLLAIPSLQNAYNGGCFQKDMSYLQPRPMTDTVGMTTMPPPCSTTSKSFLRTHRKRNFSFSSNDDDKFTAASSMIDASHKRLSLRSPRAEEKGMRKSLRKTQPQTPRPSILPQKEGLDADAQEVDVIGVNEISSTGSLRRTASRMSKKVKMRLRSFWSHDKSDTSSEQAPDQHVETSVPHGTRFTGHEYMAERERRLSMSNGFHASSEYNDTGTVVHTGYGYDAADPAARDASGETSRFTSWSSASVRRTSSTASNRLAAGELMSHQLPVISEGNGQAKVSTPTQLHRHEANFQMQGETDEGRPQPQTQAIKPTPRSLADRDAELLASGIRMRRAAHVSPSSFSSSSSSSPSLASSGRGNTPRQAIAPAALRRLQELSLNLQKVCQEEKMENTSKPQTSYDDPFYDGDKNGRPLFAFQSGPTTPADPTLPEMPRFPPVTTSQVAASPQYFFRGKSPFRRTLRENMKTFEGEPASFRAQLRERAESGRDHQLGGTALQHHENDGPYRATDDDAPLLQSDGAGQWSRVQAWQASLVHDSSTKSDSTHSPRGKGQTDPTADESSDLRAMVTQGLCASATDLGDCAGRTPVARPVQLERLHRDTVVSPEQLRHWINQSVDMEEMGSPWAKGVAGHTRENAEHADHDESIL